MKGTDPSLSHDRMVSPPILSWDRGTVGACPGPVTIHGLWDLSCSGTIYCGAEAREVGFVFSKDAIRWYPYLLVVECRDRKESG
ncbi:unnamed protein product [Nezara viridula]|uniref:Uncharacterized protein n=1 Tax=Nezara viridula TaxID=85310 RepID=A0A9P0H582_NEZVI|nr:unnamed protein product [Nezara viridula]